MRVEEFVKTIRTGEISVEEIGRGMHKSFNNACELIEDAEVLLTKRPGRALSLAILALEEFAKTILLASAATRAAACPIAWRDIEKDLSLRSHLQKQTIFAAYGSAILDKLASTNEETAYYQHEVPGGIAPLLDYMKQLGFYVDVANGRFVSPSEFGSDNREWAEWLITVARERLKSIQSLHQTEDKSVELARKAAAFAAMISQATDEAELEEKIREFVTTNMETRSDDQAQPPPP